MSLCGTRPTLWHLLPIIFFMSSIKGSKKTSMSTAGCVGPEIRSVSKRYFHFCINQRGRLYMVRITGHVLCLLLLSANGFIPSVLRANLTFRGSLANSGWLALKSCHCLPSAGCCNFSSFLCSSEACQLISWASSAFANKHLNRSITGRYHITNAGTFLWA